MAGESSVVQVNITLNDAVPKSPDFGTPILIAHSNGAFTGLKTYTTDSDGLAALEDDGVGQDSAIYKILAAFAAASPGVPNLKVWARASANVQTVDLTPTITTEGHVYLIRINSVDVTYTNGAAETVNTICDALEALIDAIPGVVATPDNATATKLILTRAVSAERFTINSVSKGFTILDTSADAGIATDLANALLEDQNWSHVILDSNCKAEIVAAHTWCVTNKKLLWAHCLDNNMLTNETTDTAGTLVTGTAKSVALLHSQDTETQGVFSGVASYLTFHPGLGNLKMWSLIALGTPRNITPTEQSFALAKGVIVFTRVGGVPVFNNNATPGTRKVATTQCLYYLESQMQSRVLTLFITQPKVAFSPTGISQIESVMRAFLKEEEDAGMLLAGSSDVQPKLYADTTVQQRAAGLLDSMKFSTTLEVSIDTVIINGTVSI
jgi:hypothetical protein